MASPIRWGIVSCGRISHDFVTAIRSLKPEENQTIAAVAARSIEDAKQFAEKHHVGKAYGSYDELIADPDIDVFYVGTIAPAHFDMACRLLAAGRPVLCEKPLCMTLRQTQELVSIAREKRVFLMEAVWSRCLPAYRRLVAELEAGTIGEVKHVTATLAFAAPDGSPVRKMSVGGGTALHIGNYPAQLANLVFRDQRWSDLRTLGHLNTEGCDSSLSTSVSYPGGGMATLMAGFDVTMLNEAVIAGTKGIIKLAPPFHSTTELHLPTGVVDFPLPESVPDASYNFPNSANLQHEALHAADCVRKGLLESPLMTLEESLRLAEMLEAMRKAVGVVYPQDDFHYSADTLHFNQGQCRGQP